MNIKNLNTTKVFQCFILSLGVLLHIAIAGVYNYLILIGLFLLIFISLYIFSKDKNLSGLKDGFKSESFYAYLYFMCAGVIAIFAIIVLVIRELLLK